MRRALITDPEGQLLGVVERDALEEATRDDRRRAAAGGDLAKSGSPGSYFGRS
jgi:hypothetical protein